MSRSLALTCGLWMISPTRYTRRSGNLLPRLVRVVDRALDAVAEAELAGEADGHARRPTSVYAAGAEQVHQPAVVVGGERGLDLGLEAEALADVARGIEGGRHAGRSTRLRGGGVAAALTGAGGAGTRRPHAARCEGPGPGRELRITSYACCRSIRPAVSTPTAPPRCLMPVRPSARPPHAPAPRPRAGARHEGRAAAASRAIRRSPRFRRHATIAAQAQLRTPPSASATTPPSKPMPAPRRPSRRRGGAVPRTPIVSASPHGWSGTPEGTATSTTVAPARRAPARRVPRRPSRGWWSPPRRDGPARIERRHAEAEVEARDVGTSVRCDTTSGTAAVDVLAPLFASPMVADA